jgi:hypothetical protein
MHDIPESQARRYLVSQAYQLEFALVEEQECAVTEPTVDCLVIGGGPAGVMQKLAERGKVPADLQR